jgi:hypothetical protein
MQRHLQRLPRNRREPWRRPPRHYQERQLEYPQHQPTRSTERYDPLTTVTTSPTTAPTIVTPIGTPNTCAAPASPLSSLTSAEATHCQRDQQYADGHTAQPAQHEFRCATLRAKPEAQRDLLCHEHERHQQQVR